MEQRIVRILYERRGILTRWRNLWIYGRACLHGLESQNENCNPRTRRMHRSSFHRNDTNTFGVVAGDYKGHWRPGMFRGLDGERGREAFCGRPRAFFCRGCRYFFDFELRRGSVARFCVRSTRRTDPARSGLPIWRPGFSSATSTEFDRRILRRCVHAKPRERWAVAVKPNLACCKTPTSGAPP